MAFRRTKEQAAVEQSEGSEGSEKPKPRIIPRPRGKRRGLDQRPIVQQFLKEPNAWRSPSRNEALSIPQNFRSAGLLKEINSLE